MNASRKWHILPLFFVMIVTLLGQYVVGSTKCEDVSQEGVIGCVKVGLSYEGYQTAVCVRDTTLRTATEQKLRCQNNRKVCWLACTYIATGREEGKVAKHCACDGTGSTGVRRYPSLDASCFIPKGDSCDWYANCLEQEFQCEDEDEDSRYAITYATKYCKRYEENLPDFSDKGKQWVEATRKCLQLKLVPMLMREKRPTCKEIKKYAFDSHVPCYVFPAPDAPSVCDFLYFKSAKDTIAIFKTIKGAWIEEFPSTLKGAFLTDGVCGLYNALKLYNKKENNG